MSGEDLPILAGLIPTERGAKPTPLGLEFSPTMTEEDYAAVMVCLTDIHAFSHRYIPIYLGDALNYGELRWGETYLQFADDTHIRPEVLRDYKWVMKSCPMAIRKPNLTYNHYKAVAPLKTLEERALWLERAAKEGWSTDELRAVLRYARREAGESEGDIPILPPEDTHSILLAPDEKEFVPWKNLLREIILLIRQMDWDALQKKAEEIVARFGL